MEEGWEPLEIGRGELLTDGDDLLIVAYGAMVAPAMATAGLLAGEGDTGRRGQCPFPAPPR